jgi:hypothetical protein
MEDGEPLVGEAAAKNQVGIDWAIIIRVLFTMLSDVSV